MYELPDYAEESPKMSLINILIWLLVVVFSGGLLGTLLTVMFSKAGNVTMFLLVAGTMVGIGIVVGIRNEISNARLELRAHAIYLEKLAQCEKKVLVWSLIHGELSEYEEACVKKVLQLKEGDSA